MWLSDANVPINHWVDFRNKIHLDTTGEAKCLIAVDTAYQLWINGREVDQACFSDFPQDRYYNTIDVTDFLRTGDNYIAVLAYYQGVDTSRYVSGKPGLLLELQCEGRSVLVSDESWQARTDLGYRSGEVPKVTDQLGLTIEYNASEDDDWKSPDDTEGDWSAPQAFAAAHARSDCKLSPYPLKRFQLDDAPARLIRRGQLSNVPASGTAADLAYGATLIALEDVGETLEAVSVTPAAEGNYLLFDLGRETCGYLQIELEAEAPVVIDIAHGQHIIDGRVRAKIHQRNFADRYITRPGLQQWCMPVRKLSGRYLELHVRNPDSAIRIQAVGLRAVEYPTRSDIGFSCSDPLLEKVVAVSQRTLKLCMLENYVDTPWREQSFYGQDVTIQSFCGYYLFGEYDYVEKCLRMHGKAEFDDRYLALCAPSDLPFTIPIFSMSWIVALRDYTLYSGRLSLVDDHISQVERLMAGWAKECADGVMKNNPEAKYWNFYEWTEGLDGVQIINDAPAFGEDPEEYHLCKTLFFLEALKAYEDICLYRGKASVLPTDLTAEIERGINRTFYRADEGLFASRAPQREDAPVSELPHSLACHYMRLTSEQLDSLRAKMVTPGALVPASLGMKLYKFNALDQLLGDQGQQSLDIIRDEWGYMLSQGATSFWETIKGDADFDDAGSLCHGWAATPAAYLLSEILGIKPLLPGFRKFALCPKFAPIDFIEGTIPTPSGVISASWRRTGKDIQIRLRHPEGLECVPSFENAVNVDLEIESYPASMKE